MFFVNNPGNIISLILSESVDVLVKLLPDFLLIFLIKIWHDSFH